MNHRHSRAFALRDLVVSLAVLVVCSLLGLSAIGNDRTQTQSLLCLSNLRQIAAAWQLYAAENSDTFVQNYHGSDAFGGAVASSPTAAPWALGWLDWATSRDNTNYAFIRETKYARLAPYFQSERNIHKCPADTYASAAQKLKGIRRVRTVSLNAYIGEGNQESGPSDPSYLKLRAYQDVAKVQASPADLFTFLDEHPDSINDPLFWPSMTSGWVDLPASLHNGAGSFVFIDGHAEHHLWRGSARNAPVRTGPFSTRPVAGDPDMAWIRGHSPLRPPR